MKNKDVPDLYHITYEILKQVNVISRHIKNDYKDTIGFDMRNTAYDIVRNIIKAHACCDNTRKHILVSSLQERIEELSLYLRLAKDLNILSDKRYADVVCNIGIAGPQIKKWVRFLSKKL